MENILCRSLYCTKCVPHPQNLSLHQRLLGRTVSFYERAFFSTVAFSHWLTAVHCWDFFNWVTAILKCQLDRIALNWGLYQRGFLEVWWVCLLQLASDKSRNLRLVISSSSVWCRSRQAVAGLKWKGIKSLKSCLKRNVIVRNQKCLPRVPIKS